MFTNRLHFKNSFNQSHLPLFVARLSICFAGVPAHKTASKVQIFWPKADEFFRNLTETCVLLHPALQAWNSKRRNDSCHDAGDSLSAVCFVSRVIRSMERGSSTSQVELEGWWEPKQVLAQISNRPRRPLKRLEAILGIFDEFTWSRVEQRVQQAKIEQRRNRTILFDKSTKKTKVS